MCHRAAIKAEHEIGDSRADSSAGIADRTDEQIVKAVAINVPGGAQAIAPAGEQSAHEREAVRAVEFRETEAAATQPVTIDDICLGTVGSTDEDIVIAVAVHV